jgi:hypothetical protein
VQGQAGVHYLVADEPREWIRLLCGYARDDWQPGAFHSKARELAEKLYDNKVLVKQYLSLYKELILAKKDRSEAFLG